MLDWGLNKYIRTYIFFIYFSVENTNTIIPLKQNNKIYYINQILFKNGQNIPNNIKIIAI